MGIKGKLYIQIQIQIGYFVCKSHWSLEKLLDMPNLYSGYRGEEVHKESLTVREREEVGRGERENLNAKPSVRFSPFNKRVTHRAATDYYNVWVDESMHE